MDDNGSTKFVYFLTGLGIGALIGILFAPYSGEQTREVLTERAGEGREYLRRKGLEVRDQAASLMERGKETIAQQREQISAAIDAGKQAYRTEANPKGTGQ